DGRSIEGAARFADGFVFVRSETAPARLKLEEIASLQRDAAEEPPAADSPLRGMQAEYFADVNFKQSAAVLLADGAYYDLGTGAPNAFTPDRYSARFTGWLTAPRSGTYRFRANGLSRA